MKTLPKKQRATKRRGRRHRAGLRSGNPAGDAIAAALPKRPVRVRHMPALPYRDVAAAIAVVLASRGWVGAKLAFEFQVLTAARSAEVRLATWDEFDLGAMRGTVPDTRMKAQREHRVPLCGRALEILREAGHLSPAADGANPPVWCSRADAARCSPRA